MAIFSASAPSHVRTFPSSRSPLTPTEGGLMNAEADERSIDSSLRSLFSLAAELRR